MPTIKYSYFGGKCPVQAEGRVNGHPFYFRARGGYWALHISPFKTDLVDYCFWAVPNDQQWVLREEYTGRNSYRDDEINDGRRFAAGWADEDECRAFIEKAAKLWCEQTDQK